MASIRAIACALSALLLVASAEARASIPPLDAVLEPGQRFLGRFAFEGDEDRVELSVLAGGKIWVTAAAAASQVHPSLRLYRNGIPLRLDAAQVVTRRRGRMQLLKRVVIEQEGIYELRLTNGNGALGAYQVTLREKLPRKWTRLFRLSNHQTGRVEFPARTNAAAMILLEAVGRDSGPRAGRGDLGSAELSTDLIFRSQRPAVRPAVGALSGGIRDRLGARAR